MKKKKQWQKFSQISVQCCSYSPKNNYLNYLLFIKRDNASLASQQ